MKKDNNDRMLLRHSDGEERIAIHHAKPEEEEGDEDGDKRTDGDEDRKSVV